jgi:hypothetical protein
VIEEFGFGSRHGQEIIIFSIATRPALGPTKPHIQWVPGPLFPEAKEKGRDAHQSTTSSAQFKNTYSYTFTPPYVLMQSSLINKAQGKLLLLLLLLLLYKLPYFTFSVSFLFIVSSTFSC